MAASTSFSTSFSSRKIRLESPSGFRNSREMNTRLSLRPFSASSTAAAQSPGSSAQIADHSSIVKETRRAAPERPPLRRKSSELAVAVDPNAACRASKIADFPDSFWPTKAVTPSSEKGSHPVVAIDRKLSTLNAINFMIPLGARIWCQRIVRPSRSSLNAADFRMTHPSSSLGCSLEYMSWLPHKVTNKLALTTIIQLAFIFSRGSG